MRPLDDALALRRFAEEVRDGARFACEPVRLRDMAEWQLAEGVLSHRSGGFFHLLGARGGAAAPAFLALHQPQGAFNGLLVCPRPDGPLVLVQARLEPGNTGAVQYGPSVQSTPANYLRAHGGAETPFLGFFHGHAAGATPLGNLLQTDLGNRYAQKNKLLAYAACDAPPPAAAPFAWARLDALAALARHDFLLNTDLKSMLAVFDWDALAGGPDAPARRELPEGLAALLARGVGAVAPRPMRLLRLDALPGWRVAEDGIHAEAPGGFGCGFYRVEASTREKPHWHQPLVSARGRGLIRLALRRTPAGPEFLVTIGDQPGLAPAASLLPSLLRAPGAPPDATAEALPAGARVLAQALQSDEGGRFIGHESLCQLVELPAAAAPGPDQAWIGVAAAKRALVTSLACSIELRGSFALALPLLNPRALPGGGEV